MKKGNNWSREELIVAFNLYCKTPFSKIGLSNKGIQELAQIINRSISAVALKLANFARLDPALQNKRISGMSHGSKGEVLIWNEFYNNWDALVYNSELILASFKNKPVEASAEIFTEDIPIDGTERYAVIKARVNQSFFRKTILASYNSKCCITGIDIPELLIASHIIPWSVDEKNRVNPHNGLCLNALHDKAFDQGLLTITPEFKVKVSTTLLDGKSKKAQLITDYHGKDLLMPQRFQPNLSFLEHHNLNIFKS